MRFRPPRSAAFLHVLLLTLLAMAFATPLRAQEAVDMQVQLRSGTAFATPGGTLRLHATFLRFSLFPMTDPRLSIELPTGVGFLSMVPTDSSPSCTTPASGSSGVILCSLAPTDFYALAAFDVSLSASLIPDTIIRPIARVSSGSPDSDLSNNESVADIYLQGAGANADLAVAVEAFPDPVPPGALITHRITLTNRGPDAAVGALISTGQPSVPSPTSTLLPHIAGTTTFSPSGLPEGWSCELMPPPPIFPIPPFGYSCRTDVMPVGSVTLTMTGAVRTDVVGPLGLSAVVSSNTPDPVAGNNASGRIDVAIGFARALSIPASGWPALALLLVLASAIGAAALRGRR